MWFGSDQRDDISASALRVATRRRSLQNTPSPLIRRIHHRQLPQKYPAFSNLENKVIRLHLHRIPRISGSLDYRRPAISGASAESGFGMAPLGLPLTQNPGDRHPLVVSLIPARLVSKFVPATGKGEIEGESEFLAQNIAGKFLVSSTFLSCLQFAVHVITWADRFASPFRSRVSLTLQHSHHTELNRIVTKTRENGVYFSLMGP